MEEGIMKELVVKEEEVGLHFLDILEKMVQIRKDRRKIYHDTFLEDEPVFLLAQLSNKIKRLKLHLENHTEVNNIEKGEDNALDSAIYSLFLAIVLRAYRLKQTIKYL